MESLFKNSLTKWILCYQLLCIPFLCPPSFPYKTSILLGFCTTFYWWFPSLSAPVIEINIYIYFYGSCLIKYFWVYRASNSSQISLPYTPLVIFQNSRYTWNIWSEQSQNGFREWKENFEIAGKQFKSITCAWIFVK